MPDARFENGGQPAVPVSKKQEVLRLLPFPFSNQTDRAQFALLSAEMKQV